jgi:tetraacyldisaccharide 4'-kinase
MRFKAPKFWHEITLVAIMLLPLSLIYYVVFLLKKITAKPYKSKIPVICIGNVNVGGVGKTQVALLINNILQQKNIKCCFITRGYGGNYKEAVRVDLQTHDAKHVGDEAIMLAKYANVYVGHSRACAAKLAEKDQMQVIIMDDGLQNFSITKDFNILVVDGNIGFGNGLLLPAGMLRQSINSVLNDINLAIIIGNDSSNNKKLLKGCNILNASIQTQQIINIKDRRLIAFAAIAYPQKFYQTITELGAHLIETHDFADHYLYNINDLDKLQIIAKQHQAELITTEKDYVKIPKDYQEKIICLKVQLQMEDYSALEEIIFSAIKI